MTRTQAPHSQATLRHAPLTVAVTGGTGFVGSALLRKLLDEGYRVRCVTRTPKNHREVANSSLPSGVTAIGWDDLESGLSGVDVVVHLAGAPAVGQRLTEARKKVIFESRVETTTKLVQKMAQMEARPTTFVCASAIGYYGDQPWNLPMTEGSPPGDDFLANVCVHWEEAAKAAESLGIRVVNSRIGIVLGPGGGPLAVMALPFKMFVGGPIAGGKQPVSWIDRRDAVRALLVCIKDPTMRGPVNVVSPQATTNGELSRLIAKTLRRPNLLPVPKLGLKLIFLEGADAIASGQHVTPLRLAEAGFEFRHGDLEQSVRDNLVK